jgi:hypothetical protein
MTATSRTFDLPPARPSASDFNMFARALLLAKGDRASALAYAEQLGASQRVTGALKAAVSSGTTTSVDYAALVDPSVMAQQFLETLRNVGVYDRVLADATVVPLRTRIVSNSTPLVGDSVAEAAAKPIRALSLAFTDMDLLKVSSIVVLSAEVVKSSAAGAQNFVGNELRRAVVAGSDKVFLSGIATGETPLAGSASVSADLKALLGAITIGEASKLYLVVPPALALAAATITGPQGFVYSAMGPGGGVLAGITVLASDQQLTGRATLVDAASLVGSGGQIVLDSSEHASVLMDDAPGTGAATKSLWQQNLLALRAERFFAFDIAASGVAIADGCTWSAA